MFWGRGEGASLQALPASRAGWMRQEYALWSRFEQVTPPSSLFLIGCPKVNENQPCT